MKQTHKNHAADMPGTEIRIRLMRADISQADIARQEKVHRSLVSRVIDGTATSDRILRAVAVAIGVDVKLIRPSTYLYNDQREPGRPVGNNFKF